MPLTPEIKTPQGATMVQRGIDSFFKSPTRPVEEKKGLLNYFQKKTPEVAKQNLLTGINKDKLSDLNDNSPKRLSDKKVDNAICKSSPKSSGPTPEGKLSKSKLKKAKKVDLDLQNDKPSVDIENKDHKSKSEEKTKLKLKLSKKNNSHNLNSQHDISQEEVTTQVVLKDVTNDSKSNLSNKNDNIVAVEVDMLEVSVEDKSTSPVKNPGKKTLKVKEIEKNDSIKPVITKQKSAFSFMMANRHKQDEVIKELEEKEKEEASSLKSTKEEEKSSAQQKPIDVVSVTDDSENDQIFPKKTPIENKKVIKGSTPSKSNAFSFLMSNRHKSPGEKETKQIMESNSNSSSGLKKKNEVKKASKKRKQNADDSVSCDSDLDEIAETKRKRISLEEQQKVDKNIEKKESQNIKNDSNSNKDGHEKVDNTEENKKLEVNTKPEKKKRLNESDTGQSISFASFSKGNLEAANDKMVDNNEEKKISEFNTISENKTSSNECDSGRSISFSSFLKENKEVEVCKGKTENVILKLSKKDKSKHSTDKSTKYNALKTVRFDNSDDEEEKVNRASVKKNSKLDSDEDEWDMDSENETRKHESKKMKMSLGLFKKQKKPENKNNNVEIDTSDTLKVSDLGNTISVKNKGAENDVDSNTPLNMNTDINDDSKKSYKKLPKEKEVNDSPEKEKMEINKNETVDDTKTDLQENVDKEPKKKVPAISNFFKKMTKEEQIESRNKNVVTIQADVHATNDGKEEECVGKNVRRSARRQPKQKEEPVELDKIELLEQVDVSPIKYYRKERIKTLNDTMIGDNNSASKKITNKDDDDRAFDKKEIETISENKTSLNESNSRRSISFASFLKGNMEVDNDKKVDTNEEKKNSEIQSADTKKIAPLEKVSTKEASTEIEITQSQDKLSEVKETPQRSKRTSAKFSLNFDTDIKKSEEKPEELPRRSRRSVSTTPEVDAVDRKSKRLRNMLQSPVESTADQVSGKDVEGKDLVNGASTRLASSVSSSGSIDSPVKYTATLDSTPGKLSLKLKKVSKLSKKNVKQSPVENQKKLSLNRKNKKILTPAEMKALLQEVQGDAEDDLDSDDASVKKSAKKNRKKLSLKKNSLSPLNKKARQMLLMSPGLSPKVKALAKSKNKLPNGSARHQEAVAAKKLRKQSPPKTDEDSESDKKEAGSRRSSRQAAVVNVKMVEISSEDEKVEEKQEKKKKRLSKGKEETIKKTVHCLTPTPSKKEVILVATPSGKHLRKTTWCGKCAGCKTPNCEKCKHCKNMPKYGGKGTLKKPCKKRKCFNPNTSTKASMDSSKGTKSSCKQLASIFMKKKDPDIEIVEVTLSPSKLKARQDFLQSGVPETIKKKVLVEKKMEEEFADMSVFPSVSHVQQRDTEHWVWSLAHLQVKNLLHESLTHKEIEAQSQSIFLTPLSQAKATEDILPQQPQLMDPKTLCAILSGIKKRQPNFPVFAVFKSYLDRKKEAVESYKKELEKDMKSKSESEKDVINLFSDEDEEIGKGKRKRRSKGSPVNKKQKLSKSKLKQISADNVAENTDDVPIWQKWTPNAWTQMYAPNHSSQVIGNADIVRKMKVWLLEWKKQTESDIIKQKSGKKKARREDDFLCSDESSGWEEDDGLANTLLLAGIPGVGKTAAVYALAQELGYKVLEVNASSVRKGAQVMKQLAEATQSHSMSGGNSSQGTPATPVKNSLAAMFASKQKKKKKEKILVPKEDSQNPNVEKEKKMAMVLFEDIDIVFDEYDDGFILAVNNIMAETKRPIILTTTYLTPNVLAKIKGNFEYLTFTAPPNDLVCHHLELMALSGGVAACPEDLRWLLEHFRGDIRQAISTLQSWLLTGSSQTLCVSGSDYKLKSLGDPTVDVKSYVKEITLKEVFPDTKETSLREVHIQRGSLFGHLSRNICNNSDMASVYRLPWTKLFVNLPRLLPFHSVEKVSEKNRYPLTPDSAEVKTSELYKKANWLSFDDESDEEKSEVPAQVSQNEKEETKVLKIDAPPDVKKSSKLCVESISSISSTLCDLDIFNSIPEMDNLVSRESDFEWRSWQPTPGLSDGYCTHQDWSSQRFVTDLSNDLSCRAMDHCSQKVKEALDSTSTPDHLQLCFSLAEPTMCKSLTLLPREPQCERNIKHLERISLLMPVAGQQNKTNLGCDYFPFLRQIARYDELGAALSHKRRGRRFLSYLSGIGIHLDPAEKITMANTLLD